jgi:hypothetical protein
MQVLTEDAARQDELLDLSIQQARDALETVPDGNDEEDSPYYIAKVRYELATIMWNKPVLRAKRGATRPRESTMTVMCESRSMFRCTSNASYDSQHFWVEA